MAAVAPPAIVEADHAAEALEHAARERVLRMALESGVVDLRDRRLLFEELRDAQRARVLVPHAQRERLDPAVQEEAGVRVERPSEVVQLVPHLLDQGRRPGDRARDDVGVAVQVLGAAVEDQVDADGRGPEVHRARERVVDQGHEPVRLGELRDRGNVGDLNERVRDRLDVDRLRFLAQLGLPRSRRRPNRSCRTRCRARQVMHDEVVRSAVEALLHEQVIASLEDGEERGRDRGHAAPGDERRLRALERRDLRVDRRVVGSVVEPDVLEVVILSLAAELVHRGLEDGNRDRAQDPRLAGVDQARFDVI